MNHYETETELLGPTWKGVPSLCKATFKSGHFTKPPRGCLQQGGQREAPGLSACKMGKAVPTGHALSGRQAAVPLGTWAYVYPNPDGISWGPTRHQLGPHSASFSSGGHVRLSHRAQGESAFSSLPTAAFTHPIPPLQGGLPADHPPPRCCHPPAPCLPVHSGPGFIWGVLSFLAAGSFIRPASWAWTCSSAGLSPPAPLGHSYPWLAPSCPVPTSPPAPGHQASSFTALPGRACLPDHLNLSLTAPVWGAGARVPSPIPMFPPHQNILPVVPT